MTMRRAFAVVAPAIALMALGGVLLTLYDVPVIDVARYLAYLVFVIVLPGTGVWRWAIGRHDALNPRTAYPTWLEDLMCGAALGYLIEIAAYAGARALGQPRLFAVVPVALLLLWFRDSRVPRVPIGAWSWGFVAIACYVTWWLLQQTLERLPVGKPGTFVEVDEMFHLSLIGELRHHFPAVYPFVESEPLNYQYFVHLHTAASTWLTGMDAAELYRRFDPVVMTVLASLGAACLAMRVTRRTWPGWVASAVLTLVGSFDISGVVKGEAAVEERFLVGDVLVHSPTQTLAFVVAVPMVLLALEIVAEDRTVPRSTWLLFAFISLGMSGSKVTYLPMFAAGFFAVAGWGLVRGHKYWPRALAGFAITSGALAASYVVLYGDSTRGMEWDPFALGELYGPIFGGVESKSMAALVTMTLVLCWLVPAAGALGLLVDRKARHDARVWLLAWSAAAGFGAAILLGHIGHSERYFERSAALLTAVLCAWGLSVLFPEGRQTRWAVATAVAAGATLMLVRVAMESQAELKIAEDGDAFRAPVVPVVIDLFLIGLAVLILVPAGLVLRKRFPLGVVLAGVVGLGLARTLSFMVGNTEVVDTRPSMAVSADGVAAASYLRDHADADETVMTNAHCGPVELEEPCDARHFWMAALSERRFVLEGWGYAGGLGWLDPFWGDPRLLEQNDDAFTSPATLAATARDLGVSWAFVDLSLVEDQSGLRRAPGTRIAFDGEEFVVLEITP